MNDKHFVFWHFYLHCGKTMYGQKTIGGGIGRFYNRERGEWSFGVALLLYFWWVNFGVWWKKKDLVRA